MARGPTITADRPTTKRIGALRALWPFLRPYRGLLGAAVVALVITAGISLILPLAVRRVVDGFDAGAHLLDQYFGAALAIVIGIGVPGALSWAVPLNAFVMAMAAALSAAHLAAILFPPTLRRLYIVRDDDPAGDGARDMLIDRANGEGIEAIALSPALGDFNEDLRRLGIDALRAGVWVQLAPEDAARFMNLAA